jgi:hypothetical protein
MKKSDLSVDIHGFIHNPHVFIHHPWINIRIHPDASMVVPNQFPFIILDNEPAKSNPFSFVELGHVAE